jgi:hypothetical protein
MLGIEAQHVNTRQNLGKPSLAEACE